MARKQFITFTILTGALLVYATVVTRRLGRTAARLNKIEEALLARSRSIDCAEARVAEEKPDVSGGEKRRGSYLTIRDLRVRAQQMSSRATRPGNRNDGAVPEEREAPKTPGEQESSSATLKANSVPASLESRDVPETDSAQQSPPDYPAPSDDSVAKKNRDMALFLSNQRRRRRERFGY